MSELAKRLPDDLLERRDRMRNAGESAVGFGFAKAHTNEGLKRLCACVSDGGTDGAAVRSAIGVGEKEPGSGSARDDERAVVGSAVVSAAEGKEIGDEVFPAFTATLEMVRLRKDRVPATGDATFRTVSAQDRAPLCGRNGLGGAGRTRAHVDASVRVVSNAHVCASVRVVSHAHVCADVPDVL